MTWFVDKLGPLPARADAPQVKPNGAAPAAKAAPQPAAQRAPAPAARPAPPPEPEPKKKKKGWF
jgi:hypothetical protein